MKKISEELLDVHGWLIGLERLNGVFAKIERFIFTQSTAGDYYLRRIKDSISNDTFKVSKELYSLLLVDIDSNKKTRIDLDKCIALVDTYYRKAIIYEIIEDIS